MTNSIKGRKINKLLTRVFWRQTFFNGFFSDQDRDPHANYSDLDWMDNFLPDSGEIGLVQRIGYLPLLFLPLTRPLSVSTDFFSLARIVFKIYQVTFKIAVTLFGILISSTIYGLLTQDIIIIFFTPLSPAV